MSANTKATAKLKVRSLIVGVGYPDRWRDYTGLEIARDDAIGNAMRAETFAYTQRLKKLREPIDRRDWWMTPQTVNALNLPIQNALNFPAAILQPPFFDPDAPGASNVPNRRHAHTLPSFGAEVNRSLDPQAFAFCSAVTGMLTRSGREGRQYLGIAKYGVIWRARQDSNPAPPGLEGRCSPAVGPIGVPDPTRRTGAREGTGVSDKRTRLESLFAGHGPVRVRA
jgi:hypothetical protein